MTSSTFTTNGVHHATDEAIDTLYAWMPGLSPTPAPLPEAAFSLTLRGTRISLKGTLDGVEALLTARGQTAAEFKRNLEAIRGLLDPKPSPPAAQADTTPICPTHGAMKASTKGKGWYCPTKNADGSWCKGK